MSKNHVNHHGNLIHNQTLIWTSFKCMVVTKKLNHRWPHCEHKHGVLRLIPKKGKDITNVKNWRPLS